METILIIEDDKAIAEVERDFLEINGYGVTIAADGTTGLSLASNGHFDLILLDLMLPGIDGYEICRLLRDKMDIPILIVSARGEELDKLRGLGLGADDYISKPFSPTELVARVKANLAQYQRIKASVSGTHSDSEITIGHIRLNPATHRVYVNHKEIELKNKEYELLYFLMSNPEIVFSKDTLYEHIWGMDSFGDTKTVAVHINRIREKIEQNPAQPMYIETVWGAGYRFRI